MGSFLFMGLIGLIIAMIVNISPPRRWNSRSRPSRADLRGPHRLRHAEDQESYHVSFGADVLAKGAIMGALSLYLDFINLFLMLLRLFGNRE